MNAKASIPAWLSSRMPSVPGGQVGRFLLVGIGNTLFGYGTYALLTAVLTPIVPHGYVLAGVLSNLMNITFAFLNYKWFVFKTKGNYLREWARCVVVYSGGIILGAVALPILVTMIRRWTSISAGAPYIAGAVLMAFITAYSFLGHRNFSFRAPA